MSIHFMVYTDKPQVLTLKERKLYHNTINYFYFNNDKNSIEEAILTMITMIADTEDEKIKFTSLIKEVKISPKVEGDQRCPSRVPYRKREIIEIRKRR